MSCLNKTIEINESSIVIISFFGLWNRTFSLNDYACYVANYNYILIPTSKHGIYALVFLPLHNKLKTKSISLYLFGVIEIIVLLNHLSDKGILKSCLLYSKPLTRIPTDEELASSKECHDIKTFLFNQIDSQVFELYGTHGRINNLNYYRKAAFRRTNNLVPTNDMLHINVLENSIHVNNIVIKLDENSVGYYKKNHLVE